GRGRHPPAPPRSLGKARRPNGPPAADLRCSALRSRAAAARRPGGRCRPPHPGAGGGNMVGVVILLVATGVPPVIQATTSGPPVATEEVLRQAETSFTEGVRLREEPDKARPQFRRSADLFAELHRRGIANPALFRDEGNACLLADDLPGAILAYRRGL